MKRDPPLEFQSDAAVDALLTNANIAAMGWGAFSFTERATLLKATAAILRQSKATLARTITLEMGKPLQEAQSEVEKSAWSCGYVADHAQEWLAEQPVQLDKMSACIAHRPLGVILAAFWLVERPSQAGGTSSRLQC